MLGDEVRNNMEYRPVLWVNKAAILVGISVEDLVAVENDVELPLQTSPIPLTRGWLANPKAEDGSESIIVTETTTLFELVYITKLWTDGVIDTLEAKATLLQKRPSSASGGWLGQCPLILPV